MKNYLSVLAFGLMLAFVACGGKGEKATDAAKDAATATTDDMKKSGETATPLVGEIYKVNPAESKITWVGSKKIGGARHTGTFDVALGTLAVDKGTITGGAFQIDINSIKNVDMAGKEGAGKLEGHLKSPDFFNVAEFPNATFKITKVTKVMNNASMTHTVSGDLTLMGIAKNISMPATVSMDGDKITASVKNFNLNRTDWDMKYGSGLLGLAQDKIINDDVVIGLEIVATK